MKAVIIEDEKAAIRNLKAILNEVKPDIEIITTLDSIESSIEWFSNGMIPELVFMDIHLADGSAFEIFEHVNITAPIIFTTAYDEYAMKAFKVNSIDYLLKPIEKQDMIAALNKLEVLQESSGKSLFTESVQNLIRSLNIRRNYKTHFLVPAKADKLIPVSTDMISFFYISDCNVKMVLNNDTKYLMQATLDEIQEEIDPELFFRVNRQYLISKSSIKDIDLWFNNRLAINLVNKQEPDKIIVSKAKVQDFKEWLTSGK